MFPIVFHDPRGGFLLPAHEGVTRRMFCLRKINVYVIQEAASLLFLSPNGCES